MSRLLRASALVALFVLAVAPRDGRAQDTTARGITLIGNYDPLRGKVGIVVLPVGGAGGDSVRSIIQRDLDYSDRFTVIPLDSAPGVVLSPGGPGLNYALFSRIAAAFVVAITPVAGGVHVALHDVARGQVAKVSERLLPSAPDREWRLGVHALADDIERSITGRAGIATTRVAYMRGASIRMVDSDGASDIAIPTDENGVSPAWNPAGTMLAYSTFGVASRIVALDLLTGRSRTVVGPAQNSVYISPSFSPDGSRLIYARGGEEQADLYAVGITGSESPHRLTVARSGENTNPTMSPDGRRIAYVSNVLGRPELYIMDSDGTNVEVLTNYDDNDRNYRSDPDWSPDGRLIAYQERVKDRFQIRTIRTSGGTPKLLTNEGQNEQPSWAPDARHLVFTSTRTGVRQLWVIDTESGRLRQLTRSAGSRLAAWSPRLSAQP